jgi:hypothetical protein
MGFLYEQVFAQALQSSTFADDVRICFEQQQLLFVRVGGQEDSEAFWVTVKDVMWSGNMRVFAGVTFIASMYKVGCCSAGLAALFCHQRYKTSLIIAVFEPRSGLSGSPAVQHLSPSRDVLACFMLCSRLYSLPGYH